MAHIIYREDSMITTESDPDDETMVLIKKDGVVVGKCDVFNNGFDEDGCPIPLE